MIIAEWNAWVTDTYGDDGRKMPLKVLVDKHQEWEDRLGVSCGCLQVGVLKDVARDYRELEKMRKQRSDEIDARMLRD